MEWFAALKAKWNEPEDALARFAAMEALVQSLVEEGLVKEVA